VIALRRRDQSRSFGHSFAWRVARQKTTPVGQETAVAEFVPMTELDYLGHQWGRLLALGILSIALGIAALILAPFATLGTVFVFGWLITINGVVEAIHVLHVRRWSGVFMHLAGGVLGVLLGLLIVTHPTSGSLVLTMLLAAYLTAVGLYRAITALYLRHRSWGWAVLDGIVTLVLGLLLWASWPLSALWFLGFAVGIALLLRGWSVVMFAVAVRPIDRTA
jgi:uncharacterized membrane protein HdeD (DUF308 family)